MTTDGRASQQWQLRPAAGGEFVLVNRLSGKSSTSRAAVRPTAPR
ncbi:RICIN domain-containing protein [Streptomyces sp. NPDC001415]